MNLERSMKNEENFLKRKYADEELKGGKDRRTKKRRMKQEGRRKKEEGRRKKKEEKGRRKKGKKEKD